MRPNILAIIPARGGSKGIPRKNVKLLCGKPLIAYTIEAALGSDFINRTVVSTEDKEIAEVAEKYKAEVIPRPKKLAEDTTLITPVLEHAVKYLKKKDTYYPDAVVLLNPTSPLRNDYDISKAIYHFICGQNDSLLTVFRTQVNLWKMEKDRTFTANYDFINKKRRQDSPTQFQENGAIYIVKTAYLMNEHHFIGKNVAICPMPLDRSVDIDGELDFIYAEALLNAQSRQL